MERMYPVLDVPKGFPSRIPWAMLAPHEGQALRNHGQTLDQLAGRGGLAVNEIVAIIQGVGRPERIPEAAAVEYMRTLLKEWDDNALRKRIEELESQFAEAKAQCETERSDAERLRQELRVVNAQLAEATRRAEGKERL
jgi:hypothetical protein